MRVIQYKIKEHVWDASDRVSVDILCDKIDLNTVLKRLKQKNKAILRNIKILCFGNNAEITYFGYARIWQEIEDVFPSLSDQFHGKNTKRKIIDPTLVLERKNKEKSLIINGFQYFKNKQLGIFQICLN